MNADRPVVTSLSEEHVQALLDATVASDDPAVCEARLNLLLALRSRHHEMAQLYAIARERAHSGVGVIGMPW